MTRAVYETLMPPVQHPTIGLDETALAVIDMQYMDADRHYGFGRRLQEAGLSADVAPYFERLENVAIPNQIKLLHAAREADMGIVFIRVAAAVKSSDANLQYRLWNMVPTHAEDEAAILEILERRADEPIIDKVTTSAMNSG